MDSKLTKEQIETQLEMNSLNNSVLQNELLLQQITANKLNMASAKINQLNLIIETVEGDEIKNKIKNEIAKLLTLIVELKV